MVDFRAGKASPDEVVHMGGLSLNSLMFFLPCGLVGELIMVCTLQNFCIILKPVDTDCKTDYSDLTALIA